jgi:microtubule-associated protein-like 5
VQEASKPELAASVLPTAEEECADGVPEGGYLVSGDDFSTVRLFNYPVVWDDAPFKAFR